MIFLKVQVIEFSVKPIRAIFNQKLMWKFTICFALIFRQFNAHIELFLHMELQYIWNV